LPPELLPPLPNLLIRSIASLWRKQASALPDSGLVGYFQIKNIDMAHVAKYRRFFDDRGQQVPLTYFYLLAQRAQIALMLVGRFPHAIPGLIHASNKMRFHDVFQEGLPLGVEVSVLSVLRADDAKSVVFSVEMSQCGRRIVTCVSEYRIPRRRRRTPAGYPRPENFPETFLQEGWTFDKSLCRRYAMISSDFNPIHLSSLLARAFGFRRAIAHGMYSIGRAAVTIEHHTGRPLIEITAHFRRPIPVATQANFGFESIATTQGDFGVILAPDQQLAINGTWSVC
jgi:acyl dehydratase